MVCRQSNTEGWGYCEPSGFKLPYVGREFVFGVVDCYTLVHDWYAREYGVQLHDYDRRDKFWDRGENLYLTTLLLRGFARFRLRRCSAVI